jgi:hypothetical protein
MAEKWKSNMFSQTVIIYEKNGQPEVTACGLKPCLDHFHLEQPKIGKISMETVGQSTIPSMVSTTSSVIQRDVASRR